MPSVVWPWGVGVLNDPIQKSVSKNITLQTAQPDAGEFSFNDYIPTTLSNLVKNQSRLLDANHTMLDSPAEIPWYNIPKRLGASLSAVNEGLQSTLLKVIVLVVVVGIVGIFGLSYVQAKGVNLAK